jgi:hemerythrin-like domain-containing protein
MNERTPENDHVAARTMMYFSGMFDLVHPLDPKNKREFLSERHTDLSSLAVQLNSHYRELSAPGREEFCVRVGYAGRYLELVRDELNTDELAERESWQVLWDLSKVYAELDIMKLRMQSEGINWFSSN